MSQVEFYFDFSCPWSYLGLVRLRDTTERNAARIAFRPVNVDKLLATENPGLRATRLSANPAKAAWQLDDLQMWAKLWGLRLKQPANWPFSAERAAAAMVAAVEAEKGMEFALAVFAACFGAGEDITATSVLAACAARAGLGAEEFATLLDNREHAAMIEANTLELIRRGGFGTPSMLVGEQLFFGNDRVPLVEWTLGPIGDAEFVMPGQHSKQ